MRDPVADSLASTHRSRQAAPRGGSRRTSDATHPDPRDDFIRTRPPASAVSVRVGRRQLLKLAAELPERDRQILETVATFRLARTDQLRSLFFSELTTERARSRVCGRALHRLTRAA